MDVENITRKRPIIEGETKVAAKTIRRAVVAWTAVISSLLMTATALATSSSQTHAAPFGDSVTKRRCGLGIISGQTESSDFGLPPLNAACQNSSTLDSTGRFIQQAHIFSIGTLPGAGTARTTGGLAIPLSEAGSFNRANVNITFHVASASIVDDSIDGGGGYTQAAYVLQTPGSEWLSGPDSYVVLSETESGTDYTISDTVTLGPETGTYTILFFIGSTAYLGFPPMGWFGAGVGTSTVKVDATLQSVTVETSSI